MDSGSAMSRTGGEADAELRMWRTFARWLLNLDGERHRAMRQRFARVFTPGRVEQYRPLIEARAHSLIDAVVSALALIRHPGGNGIARCLSG